MQNFTTHLDCYTQTLGGWGAVGPGQLHLDKHLGISCPPTSWQVILVFPADYSVLVRTLSLGLKPTLGFWTEPQHAMSCLYLLGAGLC